MDTVYLKLWVISFQSLSKEGMHDAYKRKCFELFTVRIPSNESKSSNISFVLKLLETFGEVKVIGEFSHVPGLVTPSVPLCGPGPAWAEDPDDEASKGTGHLFDTLNTFPSSIIYPSLASLSCLGNFPVLVFPL